MVEKARQKGPSGPPMVFGDPLVTRCGRESCTQQSGPLGLRLSSPGEQERHNADGHKSGGQYIAAMFGLQLPLTRKPWVTLFEPLQSSERYIYFIKKSLLIVYYCVGMYPACICVYKHIYYMTIQHLMLPLQARLDLGMIAFPKAPALLETHFPIVLCHI